MTSDDILSDDDEIWEPPTLYRLNALLSAGYVLDFDAVKVTNIMNVVHLQHPATTRFIEWDIMVHSDGGISSFNPWADNSLHIAPHEKDGFEKFISTVPKPKLWEIAITKTSTAVIVTGAIFILLSFLAVKLLEIAFKFLIRIFFG